MTSTDLELEILKEQNRQLQEEVQDLNRVIKNYKIKKNFLEKLTFQDVESADFISREKFHHLLNNNYIDLHFQPKVNLSSGEIVGAEALLRCTDKLVSTYDLISFAERKDLISLLDEHVLKIASRYIGTWNEKFNLNMPIAVNCSTKTFAQRDLCSRIEDLMKEFKFSNSQIELELTEYSEIGNLASNITTNLNYLKEEEKHSIFENLSRLLSIIVSEVLIDSTLLGVENKMVEVAPSVLKTEDNS